MRGILFFAVAALAFVPGAAAHYDFDSGMMATDETFSVVFDEAGDVAYHCHPHPWMVGEVHVVADTDGAVTTHAVDIVDDGASSEWGYSVPELTVEVGDTVTWTNRGQYEHTVTVETDDHMDDGQDTPSLGLFAVLGLLGAVAVLRRR